MVFHMLRYGSLMVRYASIWLDRQPDPPPGERPPAVCQGICGSVYIRFKTDAPESKKTFAARRPRWFDLLDLALVGVLESTICAPVSASLGGAAVPRRRSVVDPCSAAGPCGALPRAARCSRGAGRCVGRFVTRPRFRAVRLRVRRFFCHVRSSPAREDRARGANPAGSTSWT